jgi:hypothetical protein
MFRAVLKLIYFPGAPNLALPQHPELQARLQKQDEPELLLPPASRPVGY